MDVAAHPPADPAPFISEPLSWAEIRRLYPDQSVIMIDPDWTDRSRHEFRTARVVGHGKTRDEAFDQARVWIDRGHWPHHRITGPITEIEIVMFPRIR